MEYLLLTGTGTGCDASNCCHCSVCLSGGMDSSTARGQSLVSLGGITESLSGRHQSPPFEEEGERIHNGVLVA